jgi:urocanate hydratase
MAKKKKKRPMRSVPNSILLRRKRKVCPFKEAGIEEIDYTSGIVEVICDRGWKDCSEPYFWRISALPTQASDRDQASS